MPVIPPLNVNVTEEDVKAGLAAGLTPFEINERVIHAALDACGVPREGRLVKMTDDGKGKASIHIGLPTGWTWE